MSLLEIQDLIIEVGRAGAPAQVVAGLNLCVERGSTTVLVGESGSGKSMSALGIVRLLPRAARIKGGAVLLEGQDLLRISEAAMCDVRGARIGFVFQEPQDALNPVMRVGDQIGEVLTRHRGLRGLARRTRVVELLEAVGIPEAGQRLNGYPHQFSGGMKQRVMLAIALAGEPDLLIADEPTTALDVSTQAQILTLLRSEQQQRGMGMLFITHDLAVAHQVADTLAVMQAGRLVEIGSHADIFERPTHPYTQHLLRVSPRIQPDLAPPPLPVEAEPLLIARGLCVRFPGRRGLFGRIITQVTAVDNVDLIVHGGETVAIVGESGSGKTTLGRGLLRLLQVDAGSVNFGGREFFELDRKALRQARRDIQVVFQDPFSSMNPRLTVREIIEEGMTAQGLGGSRQGREQRVARLLEQVGLEAASIARFPHEFSGGQRQRICIARALAVEPKLLVCDEPTSALDVSVQAQILTLLRTLQQEMGLAYLFITHNLGVVAQIAHRVVVMHQGRIVESGPTQTVLFKPTHPYTQSLLAAVPRLP